MDADVFTTNPKSGEIVAVNEPLCKRLVSNAKLAILIFVIPLPSPTNFEPDDKITSLPVINNPPVIEVSTFISSPRLGDMTA